MDDTSHGHIILCGLGRVGQRVLDLLTGLGLPVSVVCLERSSDWPPDLENRVAVHVGDARNDQLLRAAGIATARAIIVTTNDDLTNISIALDARRMNPRVTVVVRLFDQQLGAHLETHVGVHRVFSTSAIAAPAFVGAALGDRVRGTFDVDGGTCVIEDVAVDDGGAAGGETLDQWTARAGVSAVGLKRAGAWQVGPPGSTVLEPGDVVATVRVVPAGAAGVGVPGVHHPSARRGGWHWRAIGLGLREWWKTMPHAVQAALVGLSLVVVGSVALFHWALRLPFVDALYFVVTIITTVGFGDYNLQAASPALKLYGVLLMLSGAALLATLFSIVADLVLTVRLRDLASRGCSRLSNHIIVVGLGNVGFRVVRELVRSGETVVAVERDSGGKFVETARTLAPVVLGNARAEETLQHAGLAGARAVLAVTDDDIANLGIGLAAKRAGRGARAVLRVFDDSLAAKLRDTLGVDAVLSVAGESASTFVAAALRPDVIHGFRLGNHLVGIFQHKAGKAVAPAAHSERVLLSRPSGSTRYLPGGAAAPIDAHADRVGACWFPLGGAH
jgi:voltage-gated potassium channel Kch